MLKKCTRETGFLIPRNAVASVFVLAGSFLAYLGFAGSPAPAPASQSSAASAAVQAVPQQAMEQLQASGAAPAVAQVSRSTGAYSFVKAEQGRILAAADASASPKSRALAFLANHGGLVGMTDAERSAVATGSAPQGGSDLQMLREDTDALGMTHVRFDQAYQGLKVFGAQLIVHQNAEGITGVNGSFVPNVSVNTAPALSKEVAGETALVSVRKGADAGDVTVSKTELAVYPVGLLEGAPVQSRLAYSVDVSGAKASEQVWIDAETGAVLARIERHHTALNRIVYSPQYRPENPELFVQRRENDPPHPTPFVNNLYDFAGQTYNFYASGFGRDSYDGTGKTMISVYLINEQCPNAYWNGQSTNYCPAFDADDVVSHEWSHGYTQFTHGLIYAFQSGALNEAYSDIFGEGVDLLNGSDGIGGSNNSQPFPAGQRWLVGEDLGEEAQQLLLRDMYDPDRLGDPGKVSSPNYACGTSDAGGVHTNSGVPNHAFAMIVDGTQFKPANAEIGQAAGTYNGQTITGIGLNKASAIYYRAETVYQVPTSGFPEHEMAVKSSCSDLLGQTVNALSTTTATGTSSGEVVTPGDCEQIAKAMLAVEMSAVPACAYGPLLNPDAPEICGGSGTIFSENWEDGGEAGAAARGWTKTSQGGGVGTGVVDWEVQPSKNNTRFFKIVSNLRGGRTGSAAFAIDPKIGEEGGGTCAPGGDFAGSHTLDSPAFTIPAGATAPQLSFDHYVATEAGVDGGQVEISRNGGAYELLPQSAYVFNAPNVPYNAPPPAGNNTNPNPSEFAWTGTNLGSQILGSWGTTVVNLSSVAQPGDSIKIRWTWSQDGCNGVQGWYVDNIRVFNCPNLQAPVLSIGNDYQNPDPDGSYTLNWTRPVGASGPDVLQVSQTSCAPLIADNAEGGTGNWVIASSPGTPTPMWKSSDTKPKPMHESKAFYADPVNNEGTSLTNKFTTLTYKDPITIPNVGTTTLSFREWYFNENDDRGFVEVSTDNGTNWTAIYTNAREMGDLPEAGAAAFATERFVGQGLDLTPYSGQTIRLRFRYQLGASNFTFFLLYGWYIDDIVLANDNWSDVAVTDGTAAQDQKGTGSYCYRVRSTYTIGNEVLVSPFSNLVNVNVAPGVIPIVSRKVHGGSAQHDVILPATGPVGVESRRGGGANGGDHQIVFQFPAATTFTGASVFPSPGKTAQVASVVTNGNEVAVNLTNVSDAQKITVMLLGANSGSGAADISAVMGMLVGDTNADGTVNSGDVTQTRNRSGQVTDGSNFRSDLNTDALVNSGDAQIVRNRSGNTINP